MESLILNVQAHACLYKMTDEEYCNKIAKERAWSLVAEGTGLSVPECQKKWKGLRDRYVREKRREESMTRSGAGAYTSSGWPYFRNMEFLEPFVKSRSTVSNLSQYCPSPVGDMVELQILQDEIESPQSVIEETPKKKPSVEQEILGILKKRSEKEPNEDELFLASLASEMKFVTVPAVKLKLKIDMLKLIQSSINECK